MVKQFRWSCLGPEPELLHHPHKVDGVVRSQPGLALQSASPSGQARWGRCAARFPCTTLNHTPSGDHSASRAIALAVAQSGLIQGIQSGSARPEEGEHLGDSIDNVVLFGADDKPLNLVEAESARLYFYDDDGKLTSKSFPVEP